MGPKMMKPNRKHETSHSMNDSNETEEKIFFKVNSFLLWMPAPFAVSYIKILRGIFTKLSLFHMDFILSHKKVRPVPFGPGRCAIWLAGYSCFSGNSQARQGQL